ncbi:hypothetical protein SU48_05745 [Deinococcus puniceus]|uniref:Alpha/beta hydrolase n=1 Tax=Deinococcus puniceus TaxID=1182568 RepID=A0A172TCN8_9DEIO|nr:hypothetical protein SU48_05745 [Deinococcus puniceus]
MFRLLPFLFPPFLFLSLTGCVPIAVQSGRSEALNLAGPAPDVVLLSVSGRCGPPCVAPRDNWDYLTSRGTVDAVADELGAAGLSVQVAGYASNAAAQFESLQARTPQRGFGALLADFERLKNGWMKAPHPPRLVLLGHSQGVAWLHYLTRLHSEVPVALQIDLDGICTAWRADHAAGVRGLPAPQGGLPSALSACDSLSVPGAPLLTRGSLSLKDVVWPNVAANLEVQSKRLPARTNGSGLLINYLFDPARNARLDGGAAGIQTYVSAREDHSAVSYPGSDAVKWVRGQIRPRAQEWKVQQGAMPTKSALAPAPAILPPGPPETMPAAP